jgi:hypothetical protein
MARIFTTALLCGALLLPTINPAQAETGWRKKECRYQYADGRRHWTPTEVRYTIRCAVAKTGVSLSTAMYIAYRESHYGQWATNPSSGACGTFQFYPASTFQGRLGANVPQWFKPWGTSCYNARSNVLTAIYTARNSGWGAWGM